MSDIGFLQNVWLRTLVIVAALFVLLPGHPSHAQDQKKSQDSQKLERQLEEQTNKEQEPDDVVRVRTDLVQTTFAVYDKSGKFVDNLRAGDFELRVDSKPVPVLFFDRVVNGASREPASSSQLETRTSPRAFAPEDATRTVLFFVDDLHTSAEGITRARKMLSNYIEQEMGDDDQAVVVSASGQIGFLQQMSSEKEVLRAALERLSPRPQSFFDSERPQMSIFQALAIERNDEEVRTYFENVLLKDRLASTLRANPQAAQQAAERETRTRARRIIQQADAGIKQTLAGLKSAVISSSQFPGRKLVFFVSDGFIVNSQNPEIRYQLQRVTDAAVRAGAVLYTIQASGLNTTFPDASTDVILVGGATGRVTGEDIAVQDPLTELATDTGGKALLNANDLNVGVKRALQESNDYYLLAWRPETTDKPGKDFHRIEVAVKGRPELSVTVQRGFFGDEASAAVPAKQQTPRPGEASQVDDLAKAIQGKLQSLQLPTHLLANYLDVPNHGLQLSVLMQVDKANASAENSKHGSVDVAGVIYDESGKIVGSFVQNLRPEASEAQVQNVTYLNQFDIKPGLYQVRVAARDSDGVTGMAMQWVNIPNLGSHKLALSSLLIGERDINGAAANSKDAAIQRAQLKIDKRFLQNSRMRLLTFIYNAAHDPYNPVPKLSARIDVFKGNKAVVSTPSFVVNAQSAEDLARIPYAGELSLATLTRGRYRIRVTVIDLSAKAFANQEATFEVE
ncbi:MAG TPA: VWA domain-containing protein [Pyrinomonadaceae bacterium]|nr:VWA domain-containing protein [Pyrinomonadaceae bacterium]